MPNKEIPVTEEFLIKDIKDKIKNSSLSNQYIEGFIFACYLLNGITIEIQRELKNENCLREVYINE